MDQSPAAAARIRLQDYTFNLPEDRIAVRPVTPRDSSRLLVYRQGNISHHRFYDLPGLLSPDDVLVFNNTRVIPARFHARRPSGGAVEILLMHPHTPAEIASSMLAKGEVTWQCIVGNLKRWKTDEVLEIETPGQPGLGLTVRLADKAGQLVTFAWQDPSVEFGRIVSQAGQIPLPPYIRRDADKRDREQYQTVYARMDGAVAAPTAGLHFTPELMTRLRGLGIRAEFVTLHVSAGTFLPVKADEISQHTMHAEQMVVHLEDVRRLWKASGRLVAVGTTSLRTLESLLWLGYLLRFSPETFSPDTAFSIPQWIPYEADLSQVKYPPDLLGEVVKFMEKNGLETWVGETQLIIVPGFPFHLAKGLITNYHQPGSTLILLVAAWLGQNWRTVYDAALAHDYRFLSYGDSSLLWRQ
jgi:S-adenosylmethionine:tRNA ribosyltransferase-isomerase